MKQIYAFYRSGLFKITSAAITPGTQPQSQSKKVIRIEPQPLSKTASGGHNMASKTLQKLIIFDFINSSKTNLQTYFL